MPFLLRFAVFVTVIFTVHLAPAHEEHPADPRAIGAITPSWSPDGERLAVSYQGAIWRMNREGGEFRRLTAADSRLDRDPVWSHDGGKIAFVRSANLFAGELAVIDSDTGEPAPLPARMRVSGRVAFDRDDRRLLGFFHPDGEQARFGWLDLATGELADAFSSTSFGDNSPARAVSRFRQSIFALSHDGRSIAIIATHDVDGEQTGNQGPAVDVWHVPVADVSVADVSVADGAAKLIAVWPARIHDICFRADDAALFVATERGGVHNDLWELPLVEPLTGATKLTFGQADESSPQASADGRWLSYTDNRHGATTVVVRDLASGHEAIAAPTALDFAAPSGALTVRVAEGDDFEETTARVSIRHEGGKYHAPPGSLYRLHGSVLHFYLHGQTRLNLPAGKYVVTANRGPEYETARETLTVPAGGEAKATLRLVRWTDQRAEGWISGESHIHANYGYGHWYNSPATMRRQCEGEDLTVANFMVANSDGDGVFDREFFLGRPDPLSTDRTVLYWNEEFRSTIWGHMTLLNLKWLVTPIFTGFKETSHPHDVPTNAEIADHVHDQDGLVNYTHPAHSTQDPYAGAYTAKEMPVDVALGKIDSMDVMGNQQANMAVWYRLLNCGLRLPASAGTDCFLNRIPSVLPGAVRVYVHCPGEFNYETWIEQHRAGRTFVTAGPMARLTVDGREPGDTIELAEPRSVKIVAEAVAQNGVYSLELVRCGEARELASALSADAQRRLRIETELAIDKSCWIALRVNGLAGEARNQPFAHTSPVYVAVKGQPLRSPADAQYFIDWIERLRSDVRKRNQIPERSIERVEEQLSKAAEFYRGQID